MIELTEFQKKYGDLTAVDGLNLKIEAGEMFGFIGPNGAGKSTTIRFLATLIKATGGDGTVNGHSVTKEYDSPLLDWIRLTTVRTPSTHVERRMPNLKDLLVLILCLLLIPVIEEEP